MTVADGKRQRVGGIVGLRNLFEIQKAFHHFHNLPLFRPAVAGYRLLYLKRGVFEYGNRAVFGG